MKVLVDSIEIDVAYVIQNKVNNNTYFKYYSDGNIYRYDSCLIINMNPELYSITTEIDDFRYIFDIDLVDDISYNIDNFIHLIIIIIIIIIVDTFIYNEFISGITDENLENTLNNFKLLKRQSKLNYIKTL